MASVQIALNRKAAPRDALPQDLQELPDEQLLDLFLERKGSDAEAAFETLVRRHGPMVLGVCRHILDELHDAEDAFQATFLVLARKAGTIRDRRVLGRWLYEVAYRIAIRSKTHSARRRTHEREGAEMSAVAAGPEFDAAWIELRPVLHEEVNRLPEKYRTAVVLCYLEGRTNEEAAEMLQWPVGTVKGRLSRARDMLRSRLTRRGLASRPRSSRCGCRRTWSSPRSFPLSLSALRFGPPCEALALEEPERVRVRVGSPARLPRSRRMLSATRPGSAPERCTTCSCWLSWPPCSSSD